MIRAVACAALLLAGCYDPDLVDGLPCSPTRGCPDGQFCVTGMDYCSSVEPPQASFRQLSAGGHTCGIDATNQLYCWGNNVDGQLGLGDRNVRARPTRVGLDNDWEMVAAGNAFTVAIRTDGTLWGWGSEAYLGGTGSLVPIELRGESDWVTVTAGERVWAALDEDGELLIVQDAVDRLVSTLPDGWDAIAVSNGHYCGLRDDDLYCWGQDTRGQVGDGAGSDAVEPVQIGADQRWRAVSAGFAHSCAVDDEGGLWCWGDNVFAQAGQADALDELDVPTRVADLGPVVAVVGAWNTTCAHQDGGGGGAWCFGAGASGQIGDSEADPTSFGPRVVQNAAFFAMSAGVDHVCGIDFQSRAYCWGDDRTGQLGDGREGRDLVPDGIASNTSWEQVSVGPRHVCAIDADGRAACWGKNGHGQLGDRSELRRALPSTVSDDIDDGGTWRQISAGFDHTCAVRSVGTLWCWGAAQRGQLGIAGGFDLQTPAQVAEDRTWSEVIAGDGGTCAVDAGGDLWCWGRAWSESPTLVEASGNWSTLTAGLSGSICGLRSGLPMCWSLASTEVPVQLQNTVEWDLHARGFGTSCGIDDAGDLLCMGDDTYGGLGNGDEDVTPPGQLVAPTIPGGWTAIAAGTWFTCGLRGTELYCWGWNLHGQVGDGTREDAFEPVRIAADEQWRVVSAADDSACAIREDRTVWCWGVAHDGAGGWDTPAVVTTP